MDEKEIKDLEKEELLNKNFISSVFANYKGNELEEALNEILKRASELSILTKVKKSVQLYKKGQNELTKKDIYIALEVNKQGEIEGSIDNYYQVLSKDENLRSKIKYNQMSNKFEYIENGKVQNWEDYHDSKVLQYIEKEYKFSNIQKYYFAKDLLRDDVSYHPIKDLIESKDWDGRPRIDRFLIDICCADDDDYAREVSRMIFYGGISRLYQPGCKFDYMPIFMGGQGIGKSSIVDWLALSTKWYREVTTVDGSKGIEAIEGGWICEFAELLAMIRAKEVESLKSYLTRLVDNYRPAYARNSISIPRQCIFIGTTNDFQFLVDKTGNRRYLPIELHLSKGELWKHKDEVKNYILECWREALFLYNNEKTYLNIPANYDGLVEQKQLLATDDDPILGKITDYLNEKSYGDKVCGLELFSNCYNDLKKNYDGRVSREISIMMRKFPEWKRCVNPVLFEEYGRQKYWVKENDDITHNGKINLYRREELD